MAGRTAAATTEGAGGSGIGAEWTMCWRICQHEGQLERCLIIPVGLLSEQQASKLEGPDGRTVAAAAACPAHATVQVPCKCRSNPPLLAPPRSCGLVMCWPCVVVPPHLSPSGPRALPRPKPLNSMGRHPAAGCSATASCWLLCPQAAAPTLAAPETQAWTTARATAAARIMGRGKLAMVPAKTGVRAPSTSSSLRNWGGWPSTSCSSHPCQEDGPIRQLQQRRRRACNLPALRPGRLQRPVALPPVARIQRSQQARMLSAHTGTNSRWAAGSLPSPCRGAASRPGIFGCRVSAPPLVLRPASVAAGACEAGSCNEGAEPSL